MSNGNGHRWSKFWWQDWQNDRALQSCGLEAQGFWMHCLCAMHEGTPVGHLTLNGKPMTARQIAKNAGISEKKSEKLLEELEEAGVFSRAENGAKNGTIFCRRMVRDAQAADIGRENSDKRWRSKTKDPNGGANGDATGHPNAKSLELELERKNPPVAPPWGGQARRAGESKPFRSGALELIRREGLSVAH